MNMLTHKREQNLLFHYIWVTPQKSILWLQTLFMTTQACLCEMKPPVGLSLNPQTSKWRLKSVKCADAACSATIRPAQESIKDVSVKKKEWWLSREPAQTTLGAAGTTSIVHVKRLHSNAKILSLHLFNCFVKVWVVLIMSNLMRHCTVYNHVLQLCLTTHTYQQHKCKCS